MTKRTSRELVIRWRAADPYATATQIASGLTEQGHGISRERVRQILETEGLALVPPDRPIPAPDLSDLLR